jgi:Holliday junction resolvasome RuvABC endonuclease subunit
MSEIIIGIDPGMNGGMACITGYGPTTIYTFTDKTRTDICDELRAWAGDGDEFTRQDCFAYIELVHTMPKQGVVSSGKFMKNYGVLLGALATLKVPHEEVSPAKWQRALGCLSHGDKNVTKAKAQELFPSIKCTHAISDALLIAEYGRRQRLGLHQAAREPLLGEQEE